MKFSESEANKCRWSEYAKPYFRDGDWDIIMDASESDYQGTVEILAYGSSSWRGPKRFKYLEYSYGSCSGCDAWEDEDPEVVTAEMLKLVQPMTKEQAVTLLKAAIEQAKDYDWRGRGARAEEALKKIEEMKDDE